MIPKYSVDVWARRTVGASGWSAMHFAMRKLKIASTSERLGCSFGVVAVNLLLNCRNEELEMFST